MKKSNLYFVLYILFLFTSCADSIKDSVPTVFDDNNTQVIARFSFIQESVFDVSCATGGCHNGSITPDLSSGVAYDNIVNVQSSQGDDYIDPQNPSGSYLLRKVTGDNISGSRMPLGEPPLSQAVIDSITAWIDDNAPNN